MSETFFRYNLRTKVIINALNLEGIIVGLYLGEGGTQYQVAYFMNGERKVTYLCGEELRLNNKKPLGF